MTHPGAMLIVEKGIDDASVIPLDRVAHVIGKSPSADIFADNPYVSRSHAQISVNGDYFGIRDLGSKNGTYLNGVRLTDSDRSRLKNDDMIELAKGQVIQQYHDGGIYWYEASLVTIRELDEVDGIDFVMKRGATISGKIIDASTGLPIPNMEIHAGPPNGDHLAWENTQEDGTYVLRGMPDGLIEVVVQGPGLHLGREDRHHHRWPERVQLRFLAIREADATNRPRPAAKGEVELCPRAGLALHAHEGRPTVPAMCCQ